jgi:hypothetical protein
MNSTNIDPIDNLVNGIWFTSLVQIFLQLTFTFLFDFLLIYIYSQGLSLVGNSTLEESIHLLDRIRKFIEIFILMLSSLSRKRYIIPFNAKV